MTPRDKAMYLRIMQTIAMKRYYAAGQSIREIASASGRSPTTIRRWLKKAGAL